ncbi:hypothetical protein AYI68_g910 [Smittium mucronatum]|uniref:RGS domain-containing protein n=1 Tax=Smittium mucronatum TaxID=133383 RepID=A0A1R0H6Z8_9FUNG|nr:hypothetical protein AYI68_g910 [Smittium mucronatum]
MKNHSQPDLTHEVTILAQQVVSDLENQNNFYLSQGSDRNLENSTDSSENASNYDKSSIDSYSESINIRYLSSNKSHSDEEEDRDRQFLSRNLTDEFNFANNDDLPDNETNFFDMRLWRRMSKNLPSSVRNPLDFKMLENDEKNRFIKFKNAKSLSNNSKSDFLSPDFNFSEKPSNDPSYLLNILKNNNPESSAIDNFDEKHFSSGSGSVPGGLGQQAWLYLQDHNLRSGGLPTLQQVLNRKTFAPLSLRDFAVHCSVRQPEARKWLEFYMAAVTHEKMCLAYLSGKHIDSIKKKKPSDKSHSSSKRHKNSKLKKKNNSTRYPSQSKKASDAIQIQSATESIFLKYFKAALIPNPGDHMSYNRVFSSSNRDWPEQFIDTSEGIHYSNTRQSKMVSNFGHFRQVIKQPIELFSNALVLGGKSPYSMISYPGLDPSARIIHLNDPNPKINQTGSGYFNDPSSNNGSGSSNKRQTIYYMPWPPEILSKIEVQLSMSNSMLDPHLFSEAIMYAYEVLNVYYYSVFLREATTRNCSHGHSVFRLLFGILLLLSFGFTYPISLILLDHEDKRLRLWCLIPQILGWWNLVVGFSGVDILLSLVKRYQSPSPNYTVSGTSYRNMWFNTRLSIDKTASKLVKARSIKMFLFSLMLATVCILILCLVPGVRLYS